MWSSASFARLVFPVSSNASLPPYCGIRCSVCSHQAYKVTSSLDELDEVRRLLHTRRARTYTPYVPGWSTRECLPDHRYVLSVLSAYIRWRGTSKRSRPELEATLQKLESEFPEFAAEFRAVHKSFGLQRDGSVDKHPRRSVCSCDYHMRAVALLDQAEASLAPPPPYAADEANLDLSRLLAHRLAAEAGVSSSLYAAGRDAEEALSSLDVSRSRRVSDNGSTKQGQAKPLRA